MKTITRTWLQNFLGACINLSPTEPASLRELSRCFRLTPPISVNELITLGDMPSPVIESFTANPSAVNSNSQTTLSWKVKNCVNSCNITVWQVFAGGSKSSVGLRQPTEGSLTVTVAADSEYLIEATFIGKPMASKKTNVRVVTGFSSIKVINSHTEGRSLHIWIQDLNTATWKDEGLLAFGNSTNVVLQDKHTFEFVALDPGLSSDCEENNPLIIHCRRLITPPITGDKDGTILPVNVF